MYKIYISPYDSNLNAIDFYISIIERGIVMTGQNVKRVYKLTDISSSDKVLTLSALSFWKVWLYNRNLYIINWFQGVTPEEAYFLNDKRKIKRILLKWYLSFLEWFTLNKSQKIFFVSVSMLEHYKKKYRYAKNNYFIMPCFNQTLHPEYFLSPKYDKPSFVYTGSILKWQCFDETLLIFEKIKQDIPNATLAIITNDVEGARTILNSRKLYDVIAYSVPYTQLNREIAKYKYGFLIRKESIINYVATPTKMSSYLSCGIIPICANCIGDFSKQFKDRKYVIIYNGDTSDLLYKLKIMERNKIDINHIYKEYNDIFSNYYSVEKYVCGIKSFLES